MRRATRVAAEIETLGTHLEYLRAKAALWDARDRGDAAGAVEANLRLRDILPRLEAVVLR